MNNSSYSFDLRAEETEFDTTIPHTFYDFTTYFSFEGPDNVEYEVTEGSHTTFIAPPTIPC